MPDDEYDQQRRTTAGAVRRNSDEWDEVKNMSLEAAAKAGLIDPDKIDDYREAGINDLRSLQAHEDRQSDEMNAVSEILSGMEQPLTKRQFLKYGGTLTAVGLVGERALDENGENGNYISNLIGGIAGFLIGGGANQDRTPTATPEPTEVPGGGAGPEPTETAAPTATEQPVQKPSGRPDPLNYTLKNPNLDFSLNNEDSNLDGYASKLAALGDDFQELRNFGVELDEEVDVNTPDDWELGFKDNYLEELDEDTAYDEENWGLVQLYDPSPGHLKKSWVMEDELYRRAKNQATNWGDN